MRKLTYLLVTLIALSLAACGDTVNNYTVQGAVSFEDGFAAVAPNVAELRYGDEVATAFVYTRYDGAQIMLTCYHIFGGDFDKSLLSLRFYGDADFAYGAELIGYDSAYDVAVLLVESPPQRDFADLRASCRFTPAAGCATLAIGNSSGAGLAAFDGILSDAERIVTKDGRCLAVSATTSAVNAGCSGCPVVDAEGNFLGIGFAQQIVSDDNGRPVVDANYMIPAEIADAVYSLAVARYADGASGQLPYVSNVISLTMNTSTLKASAQSVALGFTGSFTPSGFTVTDSFDGTVCSELVKGDVIVSIGDRAADGYIAMTAALYKATGEEKGVNMGYMRGGSLMETSISFR